MRFELIALSALFATSALAAPMPQPHLNLEGLKDIFLHDKREASPAPVAKPNPVAAPAPEPSINMDSFLQEKSENPNIPGYNVGTDSTSQDVNLCHGNDESCVTGGGQITKKE